MGGLRATYSLATRFAFGCLERQRPPRSLFPWPLSHHVNITVITVYQHFKSDQSNIPADMAGKEATVYIVDVGSSMGHRENGRKETNLDFALEYVWDKITTTIATGRKTAMAGVVALRSDDTSNDLSKDPAYQHISVLQEIAQIQMADLRKLQNELVVGSATEGDAISAIVVAIQMIVVQCKKLKYTRRIVLVTDAKLYMDAADLGQVTAKLKEDEIELVILGVDFDDPEYGFKEEDKDPTKAHNEDILRQLCDDCNGIFGTLAQAVDELQIPRTKETKPIPSYKGLLTLGNPEQYDSALAINIERYPKTMVASPPSASSFVVRNDLEATQSLDATNGQEGAEASNDGLAAVHTARTYQVLDEHGPGGKKDVDRDELAKGYEYGRTAVHISESDRNITTYETHQGLDIIGFVDANQYNRFTDMSRTNVIVAERTNEKAYMALSSFIHALYELESYAVARLVAKDNKEPRILLLQPAIEPEFECLYDVELPFKEDVRSYKFPPLDRVVTVSGKELTIHRNLPSVELKDAMSDYVDSMDLSGFGKDDEGEPTEYAPLDETFSPRLHRINQVIKHRAIYPDKEPPEPFEILLRYSNPPQDLVEKTEPILERLRQAADVKPVPPPARGKRFGKKEAPKPISSLDVDDLLRQDDHRAKKRIDPNNAVAEFKQVLQAASGDDIDIEAVRDACQQLNEIISNLIKHSVGDVNYDRSLELIRTMREQCFENGVEDMYNDIVRDLKKKILAEELNGDRKEMWGKIRVNKMNLIVATDDNPGGASKEEAEAFLKAK
jgi:ATP-dependent DNA helicase 2 subunit 2